MAMNKHQKRTAAHFSMIHHCLCVLPLDAVRLMYKYLVAVFVQKAILAQKSASNVGADLPTGELNIVEYHNTLENLGAAWDRASSHSLAAFHYLRLVDDATVVGKMRAGISKCAYGSFEQAIAAIDSGTGAVGGPDYSNLITLEKAKSKISAEKEVVPDDAIPTERMGTYISPSLPVVIEDTEPAPVVVSEPVRIQNYLVF